MYKNTKVWWNLSGYLFISVTAEDDNCLLLNSITPRLSSGS